MLQQINPLQLSSIWHLLKPGIEEILEDLNKDCLQELWTPEDVYSSIKVGESVLLLGDEGFVVFQIRYDKYTGTKQFFVWLGYSFTPELNILEFAHQQLLNIAKHLGCALMTFSSTRKGWMRRAKDMGFATGLTNYTMRI